MNSPYNVVGVFCDDIREEVNSRHTLIGIYPDNLYVPAVPGMLDRLSLYVRAHIVPALEVRELSMALEIPGEGRTVISSFEQDEVRQQLREAQEQGKPHAGIIFRASAVPAPLPAAGLFRAIVKINDYEVVACALKVEVRATTSASTSSAPQT